MFATLLGGLGLFLLGMSLLTDGLKTLAGSSLRRGLEKFAGGPVSALVSGALVTAAIQSSSATSLTTIGFVSAGLLSVPQALGVIFGANLGTTSTGWLVSLLGLKLSLGKIALPLVGIGALMRLLTRGRPAAIGLSLAGFGLIFVGIDTMQGGMGGLAETLKPEQLPQADLVGRLLLLAIGAIMTVVLQSSSAAVATTLMALHAGTIDLDQAAALVVGQNVGTTVTAGIAAIGASVPAKRVALGHVLFNLGTGLVVVLLFPWLLIACLRLGEVTGPPSEPATVLAIFHTIFNLLGVLLFLPNTTRFAALIERLIPDRGPPLTRLLGPIVAGSGPGALIAARRTLREIFKELLDVISSRLGHGDDPATEERLQAVSAALIAVREFLVKAQQSGGADSDDVQEHVELLHALDHLERLTGVCLEPSTGGNLEGDSSSAMVVSTLKRAIEATLNRGFDSAGDETAPAPEARPEGAAEPPQPLAEASPTIAAERKSAGARLLQQAAKGEIRSDKAAAVLERIRRLDRLAFHAWRADVHLGHPLLGDGSQSGSGIFEPAPEEPKPASDE